METSVWKDLAKANFMLCVKTNDLDKVRRVLSSQDCSIPFEVNARFKLNQEIIGLALCRAIAEGLYDMVKLFLDYGAKLNVGDHYLPIHYAVRNKSLRIIQLLIDHDVDVNALSYSGESPMHLAIIISNAKNCELAVKTEDILNLLVKAGADIEIEDKSGRTPLALACMLNCCETVKYLTKLGADVNKTDKEGYSCLLHAIEAGLYPDSEIVALLLSCGADPDHKNYFGQTALTTAVRRCSESNLVGQLVIEQLIHHNCNLDHLDFGPAGETVIHLAISSGQYRVVERLIRAGCDINYVNESGESPIERLARQDKIDLVKLLIASGSKVKPSSDFWMNFLKNQSYFHNSAEIRQILQLWEKNVAPLKHFCRLSLRKFWGRKSDEIIEDLSFPKQLKEYLLCNLL